jgi:hypothetical protein
MKKPTVKDKLFHFEIDRSFRIIISEVLEEVEEKVILF